MDRLDRHSQRVRRFQVGLFVATLALPAVASGLVWLGSITLPEQPVHLLATLGTIVAFIVWLPFLWLMRSHLTKITHRSGEQRAQQIVGQAAEGILTISKRGRVVSMNPAAEQLFGYRAGEVLDQPITTLLTEQPSQEQQNLFQDSLPVGTILGLAAGAREVIGKRKNGETFPLELTISSMTFDDEPINVAFVRDVSKRKRAQRYLTAHYATTCILAESTSLAEAMPRILQAICDSLHWELGACWHFDADAGLFRCREVYQTPFAPFATLPDVKQLTCKLGEGLAGRSGATGEPVWVEDMMRMHDYPCLALAKPLNMHGALAFPITLGTQTWGALTFFNCRRQKRDEQMLDVMAELGKQLSQFVGRKRDEEMLHVSEQRFRQLAENIHDVFWMADAQDDTILYISPSCEEVLGHPSNSLQQQRKSIMDFVHLEDRPQVIALWEKQRLGESTSAEFRVVRPDGAIRWVWDRAFPVRNSAGAVYRVAGITADITDRKRTDEILRETTQTLQALVQSAPVAINITDLEGKVRLWNPAAERIFGWTEAEVLGKPLPFMSLQSHGDDLRTTAAQGKRKVHSAASVRCRRKDNVEIEISQSTAPLRDNANTEFGLMAIMMDLTEQKRLEEQLRQSQKMEAVGQLAGGVAHDFNNLLTVISGFSEMLLMKAKPGDPMRDCLDQIRKAGERAASLTRQLLAFGRKQTLQVRVLDLNTVVHELKKMLPRLIGEDIELVFQAEPLLGRVKADPVQIEQILLNLAANARDAMPDGGTLTLTTANVELTDKTNLPPDVLPGSYVMLTATDTGYGMDATTRAHIFEPFFTTKERDKGTGLGLATTYGIVKQSRGHIEVESELGRGSSFRIFLPRLMDVESTVRTHATPTAMPSGSETLLLVEDDDGVRELVNQILQLNGYSVFQAGSGADALRICEEQKGKIAALVTDVIMPRMNGRQLAERAMSMQPNLKVLYMSGYTDRVLDAQILTPGTAFLQKPITPGVLAKKVRELLDSPC